MSVAIQSDNESLRNEVETEYRHEDHEVPDEMEAYPLTTSYDSSWEFCC